MGIIFEMWTDGIFGNTLPFPHGEDAESRFANRPSFSTLKALLIASAQQWEFEGLDHDLTRVHQGWGFPDLKKLYDRRDKVFAINETEVLKPLETRSYSLVVEEGEPEAKFSLVYPDPAGAVASGQNRVNDMDLKVTAPDGTVYYGNHGLLEGMYSEPGGAPNTVDTVENVFVKNPQPGTWKVEISATEVNQDGHLETPEQDVDFALVALGVKRPTEA